MNVEIEFLEWVHPRAGVTKVEVEGGKPLVLKAKIKHEWVSLTADELNAISDRMRTWNSFQITDVYFAVEAKLKEKNTRGQK